MTTRETQIIADREVPLVKIIREFDAPAEKVFRAHTDHEISRNGTGPATGQCESTISIAGPGVHTVISSKAMGSRPVSVDASTRSGLHP